MLLHRRSRSSGGFIIVYSITLYHEVDGFPVIGKKAAMKPPRADSDSPPLPIRVLPGSDARWLNSSENAAVSVLVPRSSPGDAVHDKLFIPAIASIGVLVIICAFCCYQLIVNKETAHPMGAIPNSQGRYDEPPTLHSQHAIGRQENGHGDRPLSRRPSKVTRKSPPSVLSSTRGSPSVRSDTLGYHHHLQQQRQQQQLQQLQQQQQQQQQDPYRQYMMAHDQGHLWQHQHPSVAGSATQRGAGVQPQPPGVQTHATRTMGSGPAGNGRDPSIVVQTVQPPTFTNAAVQRPAMHQTLATNANPAARANWDQYWAQQERQKLQQQQQPQYQQPQQQQQPNPRTSHGSSAQTSSTRVTSDILSYMTPPEARRPPLHSNQSQPQNQDYFNAHPAGSNITPSQTGGSTTHGMSVPANYNTASRGPSSSSPSSAHTAYGSTTIHIQPPSYSETRSDIQGKTTTTPKSEKASPSKMNV